MFNSYPAHITLCDPDFLGLQYTEAEQFSI